jgi:hypothetical protein
MRVGARLSASLRAVRSYANGSFLFIRTAILGGNMSAITEDELKEIVGLANSVPEEYRQKCFELLLSRYLQGTLPAAPPPALSAPVSVPQPTSKLFTMPIDVRAFLTQYGLTEDILRRVYHIEGNEVRPIYALKTTKKGTAQVEHALLMALESALLTGQFQVEPEELRQRCVDQKCYDKSNFAQHLRNNAKYFKGINLEEPLVLSPDGKAELAEVLERLQG